MLQLSADIFALRMSLFILFFEILLKLMKRETIKVESGCYMMDSLRKAFLLFLKGQFNLIFYIFCRIEILLKKTPSTEFCGAVLIF